MLNKIHSTFDLTCIFVVAYFMSLEFVENQEINTERDSVCKLDSCPPLLYIHASKRGLSRSSFMQAVQMPPQGINKQDSFSASLQRQPIAAGVADDG